MADDLDSFFMKSSKSKGGKKKKVVVQNLETLGKKLELTVKRQEELDREEEEVQQKKVREQQQQRKENEDSEWHNLDDVDTTVDLAKHGIKDMELGEPDYSDDEKNGDLQKPAKTWKFPTEDSPLVKDGIVENNGEVAEEEKPVVEEVKPEPKKYVPPSARLRQAGGNAWGVNAAANALPDIQNTEQFPSLADADEISKAKEKEKKEIEAKREAAYARERAFEADRQRMEEVRKQLESLQPAKYRPPRPGEEGFVPKMGREATPPRPVEPAAPAPVSEEPKPPAEPDFQEVKPKKNAYVPPHLRRMETEQPPNPTDLRSSNRFDSLK